MESGLLQSRQPKSKVAKVLTFAAGMAAGVSVAGVILYVSSNHDVDDTAVAMEETIPICPKKGEKHHSIDLKKDPHYVCECDDDSLPIDGKDQLACKVEAHGIELLSHCMTFNGIVQKLAEQKQPNPSPFPQTQYKYTCYQGGYQIGPEVPVSIQCPWNSENGAKYSSDDENFTCQCPQSQDGEDQYACLVSANNMTLMKNCLTLKDIKEDLDTQEHSHKLNPNRPLYDYTCFHNGYPSNVEFQFYYDASGKRHDVL